MPTSSDDARGEVPVKPDAVQTPWCTVILCVSCFVCHFLVFYGNLQTASAMNAIGSSTGGWSNVGLGLGRSLQNELSLVMDNVSERLVDTINQTMQVNDMIEVVLSVVGAEADQESETLLQMHAAQIPFLDGFTNRDPNAETGFGSALPTVITSSVGSVLENVMARVVEMLDHFLVIIRPALEQVGEWILEFGDLIQNFVDGFSTTMDRVEGIFNDLMSQLNGAGEGKELMEYDTFTLFDASNSGGITAEDISDVARLYSITALEGNSGVELHAQYDADGDGDLDEGEFSLFAEDERIPNIMSNVLRNYARRLTEVAGNVGDASRRDMVAFYTVKYFQLVCSKNATKVEWVSDALSNSSLPAAFSADIMIQLCLANDDPNVLTTADVGEMVVGKMFELHPENTLSIFDLFSETEHWVSEGFNLNDHPVCMQRVTRWLTTAQQDSWPQNQLLQLHRRIAGEEDHDKVVLAQTNIKDLIATMPAMAKAKGKASVHRYGVQRMAAHHAKRQARFKTSTQQKLLMRLLGGQAPTDSHGPMPSAAERAINAGIPARPETLQFARWLSWNASDTAERFQQQCFNYSSEASNPLDSFATQVRGMTSRFTNVLNMLQSYSTPSGIDRLENQVREFATTAANDVVLVVEESLGGFLNQSMPIIEEALGGAIQTAGEALGRQIGEALTPLADSLADSLGTIVGDAVGDPAAGDLIGEQLGDMLGERIANLTSDALGEQIAGVLSDTVDNALEHLTDTLTDATAGLRAEDPVLLESRARVVKFDQPDDEDPLAGGFQTMVSSLQQLQNILPLAIDTLQGASGQVSRLAANLDSIFEGFATKGPEIFDSVAGYWNLIWGLYFGFFGALTLGIMYYGFWASGYFGGPQPFANPQDSEPPADLMGRITVTCRQCYHCFTGCHDSDLCFWSCILLMQVLILVIFIISLVLCILAGVKAFIISGCAQIYMLGEPTICLETLSTLRSWLADFSVGNAIGESLDNVCSENNLMTCQLITQRMGQSTVLTTVFSFLAVILNMQLLIESACLHERAKWMRQLNTLTKNS